MTGPADRRTSAVIFDLDGTLTRPILDFDLIRAELGVTGPILEALEHLDTDARRHAELVLDRHERDAAERAELYEHALEIVAECRAAGHPVAILTRNTRACAELVLRRFEIEIDALRTREDGAVKPSPEPVLSLCRQLSADPHQSWLIGDFHFDILSGKSAGTRTVLMIGDAPPPAFAEEADFVIRCLSELRAILHLPES
ncbi:MAG: HAD-IA family hydrolase [Phycisphaerae bacterium]|nr:HAD-IA family hydrolase [Phycisphaerae bacterium]